MLELLQAYKKLEAIHKSFDGAAQELEMVRAAPLCIEDCGLCCQKNTPVTWGIEGQYLLSVIAGNGSLSSIMSRCEAWCLDRHRGANSYGLKPGRVPQKEWEEKLRDEVSALIASSCPMLDSDRRCAIYQARPIGCRAYGVSRVPGRECRRPIGVGESETMRAYYSGPGGIALRNRVKRFIADLRAPWASSWFLPTLLLSLGMPGKFKAIVDDGRVASAKLVVGRITPNIIWQDELSNIWNSRRA